MDYRTMIDLSGRTAVVTGAASGIGKEAARALGLCGASLELLDINEGPLSLASEELRGEGIDHVETAGLDVTDPDAVTELADKIVARTGGVDILLNSAGIARLNATLETPDEEWREVMAVNVDGTFWPCRAFGRHMIAAGKGSIVNMGSMSGLIVNRPQHAASYMASKGAVHQLTKALAVEWAAHGVRVNALAPGYVATDMTLAMRARPELFKTWMEMTPMGRCGTPEEIAATIVFLASDASSYMTGAIIAIDGGYTAW